MARGNLFLSQARGKLGSVVFYRLEGEQVSRVYTSQVSNPKTTAQNLQRAIFYAISRFAAGARYIVDQGQEGVKYGYKSQRAFTSRALKQLRNAVMSGEPTVLNVKGNPYLQAYPVEITHGSLAPINYGYEEDEETGIHYMTLLKSDGSLFWPLENMTLAQLFEQIPSLGLGKQLTAVWVTSQTEIIDTAPPIQDLNYRSDFHYSEIVFGSDPSLLSLPAFKEDEDSGRIEFNPAVLAPSWGGTDLFPAWDTYGATHFGFINNVLMFAFIVSDYSNNKWSRSTQVMAVNPDATQDVAPIAETFGKDAESVEGVEYLDQGDTGQETAAPSPQSVTVFYRSSGENTQSVAITNNRQKDITVQSPCSLFDIRVRARAGSSYVADSNSVAGINGTVSVQGDSDWLFSAEVPITTGAKIITLTTADGAVRTINLTIQGI